MFVAVYLSLIPNKVKKKVILELDPKKTNRLTFRTEQVKGQLQCVKKNDDKKTTS